MRTNIVIDDDLMNQALTLSGFRTKKETVEEALRLLISLRSQARIRNFRGKLKWEGDLGQMRTDRRFLLIRQPGSTTSAGWMRHIRNFLILNSQEIG